MPDVPIIGGGANPFGEIARQTGYWDSRNLGVQEGNINRLNAAQRLQNNYFAALAAQKQQAMERDTNLQLQADAQSHADQANAAAIARDAAATQKQYQFAAQQNKDRLDTENKRTAAMTDVRTMAQAQQQAKEKEKIDQTGQNYASNYSSLQDDFQSAKADVAKLQDQRQTLADRQKALQAKASTSSWMGLAGGLTGVEKQELQSIPTQLAQIDKQLAPNAMAMRALTAAQKKLAQNEVTIRNSGFLLDPANGHIIHAPTGKRWNYQQQANAASSATEMPPDESGIGPDTTTTTGTTAPAPVQPATNYFTGSTPAPVSAQPNVGRIRVQTPDGKTGTIPAEQADDARKAGYVILN